MKNWIAIGILLVVGFIVFWDHTRPKSLVPVATATKRQGPSSRSIQPSAPIGAAQAQKSRVALLMEGKLDRSEYALQPHEVAEYLRQNRTNAVSLLTAFAATHDREYLRMAGKAFPNDSYVQSQMLMHDVFPEDRQKWIDAFKASAPDNSFANLLSAQERMRAGDVAGALADVAAAQGKTFEDFTRQSMVSLTEAYMASGRSIAEANVAGSAEVLLPHLAQIKRLAEGLMAQAAENPAATQAAWQIGTHLRQENGGILLTDAVGLAIQNILLRDWPAGQPAPFLDVSVEEQLAANRAHRQNVQAGTALFDSWLPNAPEHEVISYIERIKTFGEWDALNWLRARHPELANTVRPQTL